MRRLHTASFGGISVMLVHDVGGEVTMEAGGTVEGDRRIGSGDGVLVFGTDMIEPQIDASSCCSVLSGVKTMSEKLLDMTGKKLKLNTVSIQPSCDFAGDLDTLPFSNLITIGEQSRRSHEEICETE
ncbi:hypothetical protein LEN26_008362 [Aphanomyces euteiches]|nr:hypothetical protein AeMF1_014909 [Aphanomyces euteiches]KAH9130621.1 hypothetical protein LEN26_008362 [Aphanomyces euteiches]